MFSQQSQKGNDPASTGSLQGGPAEVSGNLVPPEAIEQQLSGSERPFREIAQCYLNAAIRDGLRLVSPGGLRPGGT